MPITSAVKSAPRGSDETSQSRSSFRRESATSHVATAFMQACDITRFASAGPAETAGVIYAIHCLAPKSAEIDRQVTRLRLAQSLLSDGGEGQDSIEHSVVLLRNLVCGPIPIPVASWSPESGPSLFFDEEGFYGDLEISGDEIEYFLKWRDEDGEREVFDSEPIENGRIPPKLLVHLFSKFARYNAEVL